MGEWVVLGVCTAIGMILFAWARSAAEEAYEQRELRQEAEDSVAVLWELYEERNVEHELVVDSITRMFTDSIQVLTLLPPELPHTDEEHLALLDTAHLAREIRVALDLVLAENDSLRARERFYRGQLTALEIYTVRVVDSLNAYHATIRQQDQELNQELIAQLRVTLDLAIAEARQFEEAYLAQRLSFLDRLIWTGIGFAGGYLTAELLKDDDPEYRHPDKYDGTLVVDPVFACSNWGPRPIPFC